VSPEFLAGVQPIVLVGGKSTRFGRDKLREPCGSDAQAVRWLVDAPIAALRVVFGPRVKLVGQCHPEVAARGDGVITDLYPGTGPMGGILSALEAWNGPLFVLPGDLPGITPIGVSLIAERAAAAPGAIAVTACGERLEPCIGVYRAAARDRMARRIDDRRTRLHDLLAEQERVSVPMPAAELVNVNRPGDMPLR
jgi:molybdopterin-guanine dinucleotide biosynthesis protein A